MTDTAAQLLAQADGSIARDDHTTAVQLLKAAAERFPDDAEIAYRLGAEYAHLDLFDAAVAQMVHALACDSGQHLARFHLGLLQVMRGNFAEARASWQALDALPEAHALRLFKEAFENLAEDRFDPARTLLERGLEAEGGTAALDREMRRLLNSLPPP